MYVSSSGILRSDDVSSPKYVGVPKCGSSGCHGSPRLGNQLAKWEETPHAKATINLASPKAKEYAEKLKIGDPAKADLCMSCHVTAHGVPDDRLLETFTGDQGIECEACHGAGSEYLDAHKKKDAVYSDLVTKGMRPIKTQEQKKALCAQCHGAEKYGTLKASGHPHLDKPSFEEAMSKIKHWKDKS
jgi:hypothetical protein